MFHIDAGWSGTIPTDRKDMWTIYYNYYLNTIRDSDRDIEKIADVMNETDLWRDTVVAFTADHGEMGGAHGNFGRRVRNDQGHVDVFLIVLTDERG